MASSLAVFGMITHMTFLHQNETKRTSIAIQVTGESEGAVIQVSSGKTVLPPGAFVSLFKGESVLSNSLLPKVLHLVTLKGIHGAGFTVVRSGS